MRLRRRASPSSRTARNPLGLREAPVRFRACTRGFNYPMPTCPDFAKEILFNPHSRPIPLYLDAVAHPSNEAVKPAGVLVFLSGVAKSDPCPLWAGDATHVDPHPHPRVRPCRSEERRVGK